MYDKNNRQLNIEIYLIFAGISAKMSYIIIYCKTYNNNKNKVVNYVDNDFW